MGCWVSGDEASLGMRLNEMEKKRLKTLVLAWSRSFFVDVRDYCLIYHFLRSKGWKKIGILYQVNEVIARIDDA